MHSVYQNGNDAEKAVRKQAIQDATIYRYKSTSVLSNSLAQRSTYLVKEMAAVQEPQQR